MKPPACELMTRRISGVFAPWTLISLMWLGFTTVVGTPAAGAAEPPAQDRRTVATDALTLSHEEALTLFLKSNFDVLATKYGVDTSRAQQITASLLPNPILSVGLFSSFSAPSHRTVPPPAVEA